MSQLLNPYLHKPGNAREALDFYLDIFGGDLNIMTFEQGGMPIEGHGEKVMHGQLTTAAGFTIMASDTPPGHETAHGEDVSISLSGDDEDALRGYFAKLKDGGVVHQELEQAPWGDFFGACSDRFGTSWLVNIAGNIQ